MRTVIAIPPLPRVSGGLAVLYQLAARLRELNLPVALASMQADAPLLAQHAQAGFSVLPWGRAGEGMELTPDDRYLVAEGWPNMLAPGLNAKAHNLVYVQNWAYLFSALPQGVRWQDLPVSFLAVSQPVAWFMEQFGGLNATATLRPALDSALFRPGPKPGGSVRIAWMPRKNKALAEQIRQISEAALHSAKGNRPGVDWVAIHNLPPEEVARTLASCHIFWCTGFPEGLGLPPLEAMAAGCLPVGFTGFGGWDYMRQALPGGYTPPFAPRPVPWSGNGFFVPDGDVIAAARALLDAIDLVARKDPALDSLLAQGKRAAAAYSSEEQRQTVQALWGTPDCMIKPKEKA